MHPGRKHHPLDPHQILPFLMLFEDLDVQAFFEHFAIPVGPEGARMETFRMIGFEDVTGKHSSRSSFLLCGNVHLELVAGDVPAHYAYAVETIEDHTYVLNKICEGNGYAALFEHLPKYEVNEPHVQASMFRHKKFGACFQLIWRKTQIYDGMFEAPTGSEQPAATPK